MRRVLLLFVQAGLLATLGVACSPVDDPMDGIRSAAGELRDDAEQTTDSARFCLALARAATGLESGSPDTVAEATEEALARAPEALIEDLRDVAETLRAARDSEEGALTDTQRREGVEELLAAARDDCHRG